MQNLSGQSSLGAISRFQLFQSLDLVGLVIFAVFTWLPDSYYKMVGWPWIVVWQIGFLAMGIALLCQLRKFDQPFVKLGYRFDWIVGSLACTLVISSIFAAFREVALGNLLLALLYVLALYAIRNRLANKTLTVNLLWQGLVIVGTIASVIALSLWRPSIDMWLSDAFEDAIRNRFPLGHHNFSGGYFVLVLPLIGTYAFAHKGWRRWLGALATASCAAALYASGSRGAWLGAIVSILVSFAIALLKSSPAKRRSIFLMGLITIFLGGALLFSNPRVRNAVKLLSSTNGTSQSTQIVLADSPTKDRWFMIKAAVNVVKTYPVLGTGPGNLARVYNQFRPIEAGTGLELAQQLHNTPLQIIAELGILGFAIFTWFAYCCLSLWRRLIHVSLSSQHRWLHVGIGASLLGYSISSLTDYQLENIGIASTLLVILTILLGLMSGYQSIDSHDTLSHDTLSVMPQKQRRWFSLIVLAILGLCLHSWVPTDIASSLSHSALKNSRQSNIVEADFKWAKAADIIPWDPTPSALAAEQLVLLLDRGEHAPEEEEALVQRAIEYYQMALKASPNDSWFNLNLAVLNLSTQAELAEKYASKAVQLNPRNQNYTYWTLGLAYLAQAKESEAIISFTLEAIANPLFLTMTLWQEEPFRQINEAVVDQFLSYYEKILDKLAPGSRFYNLLHEKVILIRWWYGRPIDDLEATDAIGVDRLRPIVQAVIHAETHPTKTLELLDQQLSKTPEDEASHLLKAWISPKKYLAKFLEISTLNDADQRAVQEHITTYRSLRTWLTSVTQSPAKRERNALVLAYRNADANSIGAILRPDGLEFGVLIELLNLFPPLPRELPELDQQMELIRTESLDITHPTKGNMPN